MVPESLRLVITTTVPDTAYAFLRGQLAALRGAGFDVTLITSPDSDLAAFAAREGVKAVAIPIAREISPLSDLRSLVALAGVVRRIRPHIVSAGTPKAGLLGMLAAWLNRVPVRVYHLRGLRMETSTGSTRVLLAWMERISAACSHVIVCNSPSLRRSVASMKLAPAGKLMVLGIGTSNGIDVGRFVATSSIENQARAIRSELNIPRDSPVIGFVGRLTRDKGIVELVEAFNLLRKVEPTAHLLLVGRMEEGDPLPRDTIATLKAEPNIHLVGFVRDPAPFYHVMDLLAFPSQREGFPNAPLEAAAASRPTVGYRVTGVMDAVEDGVTGLLVQQHDTAALGNAMRLLLKSNSLREILGRQAQSRVSSEFESQVVWRRWISLYSSEYAIRRGRRRAPGRVPSI